MKCAPLHATSDICAPSQIFRKLNHSGPAVTHRSLAGALSLSQKRRQAQGALAASPRIITHADPNPCPSHITERAWVSNERLAPKRAGANFSAGTSECFVPWPSVGTSPSPHLPRTLPSCSWASCEAVAINRMRTSGSLMFGVAVRGNLRDVHVGGAGGCGRWYRARGQLQLQWRQHAASRC